MTAKQEKLAALFQFGAPELMSFCALAIPFAGFITALQMLWIDPRVARGVLRRLAFFQAKSVDPLAAADLQVAGGMPSTGMFDAFTGLPSLRITLPVVWAATLAQPPTVARRIM